MNLKSTGQPVLSGTFNPELQNNLKLVTHDFLLFPIGGDVESVGASCAEMEGLTACSVSPRILPDHLDEGGNRGSPIRRTDSPSKRKGMSTLFKTIQPPNAST